ncbi:MAG: hypothetical protein Q4P65_04590, partial [Eubacteriales bacterium]|nr:hypothetical protein [Eubacteriales bacterium]
MSMHKYLKYRDRTLALALILLILLGLYAIFSNSSFVQAVPLPNSSNDLVSFSGGSESENSAITVIVMFYDLDDSGGQYKSLTEHSFVAGTGATLGFNPPEKTGYVWKKEYSKLPKTLPKGTSKVYLVLIPEDSGDEVPNPEYGVITDSDLMPEQPIEESSSENTSTAGSEESSVTTEATESTTTVETTKPTESTKQTEATESTKSTDPTESAKPTEEEEPTESTKPEDKPDEEEPKPGEVEDNVLIEQKPGGAEFTTPDDFDEEEAKEGSIKLEIYYIDKEGELQIFSLDYQLAEGLAGQSYKLILPEFKGYSLFDEPLSTLLEGELKAGTKKIKLAYVSEESDLTDAEIRETISDLLNEDGQYLSTEEESDDEKESEE